MTVTAEDADESPLVCRKSDSLFEIIEKCLDNGVGMCFVLDEKRRLLGRLTLDDIRRAIRDGTALGNGSLERHVIRPGGEAVPEFGRLRDDEPAGDLVMPIVDGDGRLVDVVVDRSKTFVQIARPDLSRREFRALLDAFISSWISSKGACIEKFEEGFADFVGARHGVTVSNGTTALHLALVALGIGPGDEVVVPDLTFAATINAVLYCGATPVIVDVDPTSWTISAEILSRALTARTKAVIPVHLYGRPAEIAPIVELAHRHRVHVVEDCAEAHGARYAGRRVGQFGDLSCFSFYANKLVTTGEGGICLTGSDSLAARLRELRDHGMAAGRPYWHERVGYNYRMTNLQAAIGQAQLSRIADTLARNQRLTELYRALLTEIPGVTFPPAMGRPYQPVTWLVCVRVPADRRAALIEAGWRADIEMRPFFYPLSAMPPYQNHARSCPNSAALAATGVNLPTSNAVDGCVVERVAEVFRQVLS